VRVNQTRRSTQKPIAVRETCKFQCRLKAQGRAYKSRHSLKTPAAQHNEHEAGSDAPS
jgi:hypothetical protein